VINECDLLVLDDAHGAEQHVADMWTVSIGRFERKALFEEVLKAIRPGLSESQVAGILAKAGRANEMVENRDSPVRFDRRSKTPALS